MAEKTTAKGARGEGAQSTPLVAAALTGVIYQAKLFNRQARMNVPEHNVISEVIHLWRTVMDTLNQGQE